MASWVLPTFVVNLSSPACLAIFPEAERDATKAHFATLYRVLKTALTLYWLGVTIGPGFHAMLVGGEWESNCLERCFADVNPGLGQWPYEPFLRLFLNIAPDCSSYQPLSRSHDWSFRAGCP